MTIAELLDTRSILVCTGTGGVGKTTTSAALGLAAARRGRSAVVVTVDPARRLADTLGIAELSNTPIRLSGPWPGELWALTLDTKTTFDDLVAAYATEPGQAERILANRFYRNIAGTLSGTHEYMAAEKLHELHELRRWDLVIVDTPPTRQALDFLEASGRLTRFLDHRLYRALSGSTRTSFRAVNVATRALLKSIGKVVGGAVIDDALDFFDAFDGMEDGFRDRANRVQELLTDQATGYVLVASARADTVAEASWFAERLTALGLPVAALVLNRMTPRFGTEMATPPAARVGPHWANLDELTRLAEGEWTHVASLMPKIGAATVVSIPLLDHDVTDLDDLGEVADLLLQVGGEEGEDATP